jgi:hypothetical protein
MARWIENDAQWYEQRLVHCNCCGRLIAKHFLMADVNGAETIFCSEACEALYRDYVLPQRGPTYRPPTDALDRYEAFMAK